MKIIVMISILIASLVADANYQRISHNYYEALGGIELKNACVTKTQIKTIKPQKVCVQYEVIKRGAGDLEERETVCRKSEIRHLVSSRYFERSYCVERSRAYDDFTCVKFETRTEYMPNPIKISIVTSYGEYDDFPGKTENFTFPQCQEM